MTPTQAPVSMDAIHAECEELGECWLWQGPLTSTGHPLMRGPLRRMLVRRYMWTLLGHELPQHPAVLKAVCGELRCCAPKHLAVWSRSQLVADTYTHSRNTAAEYGARLTARVRQGTKITLDIARAIRVDPRTSEPVAKEFGISQSMVRKIRQGLCWREAAPSASVFTWRPPR